MAATLAAFFTGMYVQYSKIFPFPVIKSAYKTLIVNLDLLDMWSLDGVTRPRIFATECAPVAKNSLKKMKRRFHMPRVICQAARVAHHDAAAARVEFTTGDKLNDLVLVTGEIGTFLDHCPGPWGCLAAEYSRSGQVSRTWPLRLEDVEEAKTTIESDYPYEHPLGWSFSNDLRSFSISPYPNGDLLVVFHLLRSHPHGGGVARVAPDGRPRWYRKDYSHHWPYLVDQDLALVPGLRFERASLSYPGRLGRELQLRCPTGMIEEDQINVIDGRGRLLEEIPILNAILQSPHAGSLVGQNGCDPTHLNFVHMLGEDAGGAAGIAPGDLVVSLRNLNAFGILDRDTHQLKRLVRGSFRQQHGVRHLEKARFLIFDNQNTGNGLSRLLMVDLATGKETTIFPSDRSSEQMGDWYVQVRGQFDVSPDKRRVLLADYPRGRGFEIRLSDGKILNTFLQIHDLSTLPGFPDELAKNAWIFELDSLHYANRWEQ